jgi:very-short-patch-repair endonuclease
VHPDIVDRERRVVLEADSWEFHSGRDAFARDCRRYTLLVVRGWTVLRFTWRQVMHDPDFVRWCLLSVIEGAPHEANAA